MDANELLGLVGGNVRRLRLRAALTQLELAHRAGMGNARLCDLENGKGGCTLVTLAKIASVLGVPAWVLLKPAVRPEPPPAAAAPTPSPG